MPSLPPAFLAHAPSSALAPVLGPAPGPWPAGVRASAFVAAGVLRSRTFKCARSGTRTGASALAVGSARSARRLDVLHRKMSTVRQHHTELVHGRAGRMSGWFRVQGFGRSQSQLTAP